MSKLLLYYKIIMNYIIGRVIGMQDIGIAYDAVNEKYDRAFGNVMYKYNIEMLSALKVPQEAKILDLACGTGYNSKWLLQKNPNIIIDGVYVSKKMLHEAAKGLEGRARLFQMQCLNIFDSALRISTTL